MTRPAPFTAFDSATQTGSSGSTVGPFNTDLAHAITALRPADPENKTPVLVELVIASASA